MKNVRWEEVLSVLELREWLFSQSCWKRRLIGMQNSKCGFTTRRARCHQDECRLACTRCCRPRACDSSHKATGRFPGDERSPFESSVHADAARHTRRRISSSPWRCISQSPPSSLCRDAYRAEFVDPSALHRGREIQDERIGPVCRCLQTARSTSGQQSNSWRETIERSDHQPGRTLMIYCQLLMEGFSVIMWTAVIWFKVFKEESPAERGGWKEECVAKRNRLRWISTKSILLEFKLNIVACLALTFLHCELTFWLQILDFIYVCFPSWFWRGLRDP